MADPAEVITFEVAKAQRLENIKPAWDPLTDWEHYSIQLGTGDWSNTIVTVDTAWGGGNNGRDHWGWPYGGAFAASIRGDVSPNGTFEYFLQANTGSSPEVGCVFRWMRRGVHGASVALLHR